MGRKVSFITGITGQAGSYLAELLLANNYEVHGLVRRASTPNTKNIDHIKGSIHLHYGDLIDGPSLINIIGEVGPDEIYHLGAQSHVRVSFDNPSYTTLVNASGTLNMLEALKHLSKSKQVRFMHTATSEMFGDVLETPQRETTPLNPQSPYGCAKVCAYHQVINYRKSYNLFASNAICFNYESPRRGEEFVTRKLSLGAARIKCGLQTKLYMGNMDSFRDWGYAKDYVYGMYLMLQHPNPDDFILATNETHSIREFADLVFGEVGLDPNDHIEIDPKFYRPSEVNLLLGDYSKANRLLGWSPQTKFEELAKLMIDNDLKVAQKECDNANNY